VNTVADLVPGVTLTLAGTGHTTLGTAAPTAAIGQAVSDFVDTYNALHAQLATELDAKTGELRADPAARALLRSLGQLPATVLATGGDAAPRTLADLGVKTNRDGSLSLDATQLADRLRRFPAAAEAMFASGTGLSTALSAIATRATARDYGFDAETAKFQAAADRVGVAQGKASDDAAAMTDRLTAQFATMDSRVAAYKSTQAFLTQQIDVWTKSTS
ncbi:flagellar filament capping protein FliD, partial [Sphingomonas bacterium]|uniref:flagellar filament capping protein FliD n=1 Tax=Sphingomonas bacterium TaxID=1895847 RepID=UPI0015770E26